MADERSYEYTPPEFSMTDETTASTSCGGTPGASSALDAYTTIPDDAWKYPWNTQPMPITDGTYSVEGDTENGMTSYQELGCVSSIENARPSTIRAGMDAASANFEDGATNSTATGGRKQQELCGICGNASSRRGASQGHANEHTVDTAHFCKACDQSSVKVSKSVDHGHKPTSRKHKCLTCDKLFHRAGHLAEHYRTHTDERPYKCETCDKAFRRATHLDSHKLTHTGEKLCICKTCGKSFTRAANLLKHEQAHEEEKRCVCQKCAKSFKNKYDLERHVDSECGNDAFVGEIFDRSFQKN
nr:zinc finger protein 8-like isoform X2 [Dermacentor andersoni]